jgi:endonuclease/exonuclease/phosphatase family metal-dependent hydrolase
MRMRLLAAALCSATVFTGTTGTALVAPAQARAASTTLRIGSFNISSVTFDSSAGGNHQRWLARRPVIVSQILSRHLDVVGLQEANQSSIYGRSLSLGVNQFMDLRNALNRSGGHYAVTNRYAYNCLRATSSQHCRYRKRGAAQDNRILYNTRTVSLVHQGSVRYRHRTPGKNPRFMAWAVLRSKATGKRFLFTDTHLDPYRVSARKGEWSEMMTWISRHKRSLPVIAVGDFNTSKFDTWARSYLPAMKRRGYGDVLNQSYRQPVVRHRRAASVKQGWINSFNGWKRDVGRYAYEDAKYKTGNGIDWIFASNRLAVRGWEVVAHVSGNRVQGVLPSDHNLVRASIVLR